MPPANNSIYLVLKMKTGIYIHIPFCRKKCDYCSFYSIPVNDDATLIQSYVERVIDEMSRLPEGWYGPDADTIYFGGGTPSILKAEQVESLIRAAGRRFNLDPESEITIEMNPDDLSGHKLDDFIASGVNRIVLGVQSLDDDLRKFIGRRNRWCGRDDLDLFFSHGKFTRCIDLITGIPGEYAGGKLSDLKAVTEFRPQHISLYLLSVEDGTPLAARFRPDDSFEELQLELWKESMDYLKDAGYSHYEISNYSLPGFESRHNSKYWHFVPYAGFGAGAHSFTGRERYTNELGVQDYLKSGRVEYSFDKRDSSDVIVEFFMTALRDLRGFTESDFRKITGFDIPPGINKKISEFISSGLLAADNGRIHLTRDGLYRANRVIYAITEEYI